VNYLLYNEIVCTKITQSIGESNDKLQWKCSILAMYNNKGNNKITELRTILQHICHQHKISINIRGCKFQFLIIKLHDVNIIILTVNYLPLSAK
jgi:hypothetical protein